eukprot:463145_1
MFKLNKPRKREHILFKEIHIHTCSYAYETHKANYNSMDSIPIYPKFKDILFFLSKFTFIHVHTHMKHTKPITIQWIPSQSIQNSKTYYSSSPNSHSYMF